MNNLTMNNFWSVVYSLLFWIIYQLVCWFFSSKIQLVSNSKSFPEMFSLDSLESFCYSGYFVEKKKDENLLVNLLDMVNMVEQTSLNSILFFFICGLALFRSTIFLLLTSGEIFFKNFSFTHCSFWEYKSALNIWLFKNSK